MHAKARTTAAKSPARAQLIERMKEIAAAVEKERDDATRQVELGSPAAAVRDSRPETDVCQQPQRSVLCSEACAPVVYSPVPPLGRLM